MADSTVGYIAPLRSLDKEKNKRDRYFLVGCNNDTDNNNIVYLFNIILIVYMSNNPTYLVQHLPRTRASDNSR